LLDRIKDEIQQLLKAGFIRLLLELIEQQFYPSNIVSD
jgi:hypothetical protein